MSCAGVCLCWPFVPLHNKSDLLLLRHICGCGLSECQISRESWKQHSIDGALEARTGILGCGGTDYWGGTVPSC